MSDRKSTGFACPCVGFFSVCILMLIIGCVKVKVDMVQQVQGLGAVSKTTEPTLLLEFDSIAHAESTTTKGNGVTLETAYCMGDYPDYCEGLLVEVKRGRPIGLANILTPDCITKASLDQQIGCTRDLQPAPGQWYAHGLATPSKVIDLAEGNCSGGYLGELWDLGAACNIRGKETPGHEASDRQDFVVYDTGRWSDDTMMGVAVHELGHVLNLHHQDYEEEGSTLSGELGSISKIHLQAKNSSKHTEEYRHLAPGPAPSKPFCEYTAHHADLHSGACCGGSSESHLRFPGIGRSAARAPLPRRMSGSRFPPPRVTGSASLSLRAEKVRYCPGEPITLEVVLTARSDLIYFDKLDPSFGFLALWAADASGRYHRLRIPRHIDSNLSLVALRKGEKKRSKIDVWFGTGIDQVRSSQLRASFSGFEQDRQAVVSQPVRINIEDYSLCDKAAGKLFQASQARRLLWLLGGDHLEKGRRNLERISEHHGESVYAPYANLALGMLWALPFHHVTERGTLAVRVPDEPRALSYFEKAENKRHLLPPFYNDLLPEIGRVPRHF